MRASRWITGFGSLFLFVTAIGHGSGYSRLAAMLAEGQVKEPLNGIARACWLTFSVEMIALAIIAFLASRMPEGAKFVLLCALVGVANGALLLKFLGPSLPVYLTAFQTAFWIAGGLLQRTEAASA